MDFTQDRIKHIDIINSVIGDTDVSNAVENYVFQNCLTNNLNKNRNEIYKIMIYEILHKYFENSDNNYIYELLKNGNFYWNDICFSDISSQMKEQDDFIENPFEIEEGVLQCKKCNSKRVFSYTKQDRSCDEGTSVYAQCVVCKSKWRERG